ncbi:ABC transporter permease [Spirochaeta thermophila]|uniref:ABC transporter permease n=1 Tax=Winmispira thermophila TaxID=154 RepID=UPI00059EEB58|nr:FtsX-like permease family protein [Spirochaeta thermophila]
MVPLAVFAGFVVKALVNQRNRTGVILLSLVVGAAVFSAVSLVTLDVPEKMSRELRNFGANVLIVPAEGMTEVPEDRVGEVVSSFPGEALVGWSPLLYGKVRLDLGEAMLAGGRFPDMRKVFPYWQVEGSWIGVPFDNRNVMMGSRLAEEMELEVGDEVVLYGGDRATRWRMRVKGIVETGGEEELQLFVNIEVARAVLDRAEGVDLAALSVDTHAVDLESHLGRIQERFPDVQVKPVLQIARSEGAVLEKVRGLFVVVAAVMMLIVVICVMTTLIAVISERRYEIALMRAIGAELSHVVRRFVAELLVLSSSGALVGVVLGWGIAQWIGRSVFGTWIDLEAVILPSALVLTGLVALVAAFPALWIAGRIDPARILKNE